MTPYDPSGGVELRAVRRVRLTEEELDDRTYRAWLEGMRFVITLEIVTFMFVMVVWLCWNLGARG